MAEPVLAPDLEVGFELRRVGHRHLEEHRRLVVGDPVRLTPISTIVASGETTPAARNAIAG
ncbi:MAG TPA: hypothetical protein VFV73_24920 [Streptosporangiaceae bacterium]|nr:hypothetical protein [Streptosporangiaceae bacterium]